MILYADVYIFVHIFANVNMLFDMHADLAQTFHTFADPCTN